MASRVEMCGALRDITDPMIVMRRVVDQALALIPTAEGAVVELVDGDHLVYVCAAGTLLGHVGTRLRAAESLSGLAVRTGQTIRCDDAATDGRVDYPACQRVGAVSMICVPLRRGNDVGVLKVSAPRPHSFGLEDVDKLTQLADFIGGAIAAYTDLSRLTENLLGQATPERRGDDQSGSGGGTADDVTEFAANVLHPGVVGSVQARLRVEGVLARSDLSVVCQPIVDLDTNLVVGAEALARFPCSPRRSPDQWFDEAHQVGLGVDLELAAARAAIGIVRELPDEAYLAINAGPAAITAPALVDTIEQAVAHRVVVELTEHVQVENYPQLRQALGHLRSMGVRLAIDDTGSGFAGLGYILKLAPDIIKLDREITSGIDVDPVRRALASALVNFAAETGASVTAEGIETSAELAAVTSLGIRYGQGFLLGRPGDVTTLSGRHPA